MFDNFFASANNVFYKKIISRITFDYDTGSRKMTSNKIVDVSFDKLLQVPLSPVIRVEIGLEMNECIVSEKANALGIALSVYAEPRSDARLCKAE